MEGMKTIYLAGGLFNAPERLHNLFLERHLVILGRKVILPQREALKFQGADGLFDINRIVTDCQKHCSVLDNVVVGNSDGADADSGTAFELGVTITANGIAVVYRTDFRTALENELGVNAMLRAKGAKLVYYPCFFTELNQVAAYYRELAKRVHEMLLSMGC